MKQQWIIRYDDGGEYETTIKVRCVALSKRDETTVIADGVEIEVEGLITEIEQVA